VLNQKQEIPAFETKSRHIHHSRCNYVQCVKQYGGTDFAVTHFWQFIQKSILQIASDSNIKE